MAEANVTPARSAEQVARLLDLPEVTALVSRLDALHWTGRPGYGPRALVGMCLIKSVYCIPVWTRVAALVRDHAGLRAVLGCAPSESACYRFTRHLREHPEVLVGALEDMVRRLAGGTAGYGQTLAIDGSDLPAYANGQKYVSKGGKLRKRFSDPEASWGHRSSIGTRSGGGFYGYKVHAVVDTATDLPVAWTVRTARDSELPQVPALLDLTGHRGVTPAAVALDKGYDAQGVYAELLGRGIRPVIALKDDTARTGRHKPPACEHGEWAFAGADDRRRATKWRCPARECAPRSVWLPYSRLHPPIPHDSTRHKALYRRRTSVERAFGRLKNEWAMLPLRVRGLDRVRLHVDLTMLACLGSALLRNEAATAA